MFTLCRVCKKLWCGENCNTPLCKDACLSKVDFHRVKLDWCGVCRKEMMTSFERQMVRKLLPFRKLRLEEEEDGA